VDGLAVPPKKSNWAKAENLRRKGKKEREKKSHRCYVSWSSPVSRKGGRRASRKRRRKKEGPIQSQRVQPRPCGRLRSPKRAKLSYTLQQPDGKKWASGQLSGGASTRKKGEGKGRSFPMSARGCFMCGDSARSAILRRGSLPREGEEKVGDGSMKEKTLKKEGGKTGNLFLPRFGE